MPRRYSIATVLARHMPDHTKGEVFDEEGNIVNEKTGLVHKFSANFDGNPPPSPPPPLNPLKQNIALHKPQSILTRIKESSITKLIYSMLPGQTTKEKSIFTPLTVAVPLIAVHNDWYIVSQETWPAVSFLLAVRFLQVKLQDMASTFIRDKMQKYDNETLKIRLDEIAMNEESAEKLLFLKEHPAIVKEYYSLLEDCTNMEEELHSLRAEKEFNLGWTERLDSSSRKEKERLLQQGKERHASIMKGIRLSLQDPSLQDRILEQSLKDLEAIPVAKD